MPRTTVLAGAMKRLNPLTNAHHENRRRLLQIVQSDFLHHRWRNLCIPAYPRRLAFVEKAKRQKMKVLQLSAIFFSVVLAGSQLAAQDLKAFWQKTRERLALEPMETKVEVLNEPLPYKKCKVTLRSL